MNAAGFESFGALVSDKNVICPVVEMAGNRYKVLRRYDIYQNLKISRTQHTHGQSCIGGKLERTHKTCCMILRLVVSDGPVAGMISKPFQEVI